MVLGALAAALVVPQAFLVASAIAPVVTAGAGVATAWPWLLAVLPLLLVRFALTHAADRGALAAAARVKIEARAMLARHLASLPRARIADLTSGGLASDLVEGVDAFEPYVARFLAHLGILVAVPLVILAVVLPRDPVSALVLLVTAPVIPVFMVLLGHAAEGLNRRQWQRLARLSGRVLDSLQRLTTIKALNAADREAAVLAAASEEFRRGTMGVLRVAFLSSLALEFFATVGVAVVAVLIGFRLLDGSLGFEAGFFVLLLAPEFYAPLRQLGQDYHARAEALAAAERLVALLSEEPERGGTSRPALGHHITLSCEGVSLAHRGRAAVRDVSFRLEPYTTTALVGPSGAGKSTLLALVLGFARPQTGRVLIDGQDLAQIDPDHFLRTVAYVPQRPHMFAGTVADNIRLADPSADAAAVREAARLAAADGFIDALPQGYDTPLGEHGHTLSGGEVQRIALARAFLKRDARLLVMDEGTTGLDRDTEAAVSGAVRTLAAGRTTLLVAHRLATVQLADHILVMDGGLIVEAGTRATIERDGPRFAALMRDAGLQP